MDPFPKTVAYMCRVLAGWKNNGHKSNNRHFEANDGVGFATTDGPATEYKRTGKKKAITCYKCKK